MTAVGKPVLYPVTETEFVASLIKHASDQPTVQFLQYTYRVQQTLDQDIENWEEPAEGKVDQTIEWLQERNTNPDVVITPDNYRIYARSLAVNLLFVISNDRPIQQDHRVANESKWEERQQGEYWRCVAICSTGWRET
ncbi:MULTISPECIES: hypothetical protein [unclassified Mesorhizobium]|uniref:hypothetical protein n=1 Tax=unclassified Mesorhizobium TaxID=325217 RepID=UPI0011261DDB|nr:MULTISPECIES: hypothetical protein [unclassified Mesorhizobium]TPJ40939.1 hypothetical protein FJ437_24885 [Mesorhizobium sp. B2-6-6]MBZ9985312.1 hypothetical protein [Mesorhizobium sp. BR-1-1-8]MCA0008644.1 hypothetical protein [Mesorhizobium sp. B264B1B]MCA0019478.1 hypothetical protein [Mesorhizobium sp. B264B1A]MCA0024481.1 hypothetical protein [Mesorhizobium sp. B263B1A]